MSDEIDRKFSIGSSWDNSIDCDDASDGSEGGYDRHGNFINANGMMEIITLRVENDTLRAELAAALKERDEARAATIEECAHYLDSIHHNSTAKLLRRALAAPRVEQEKKP